MIKTYQNLKNEAFRVLGKAASFADLTALEHDLLGRRGRLTQALRGISALANKAERRQAGLILNDFKKSFKEALALKRAAIGGLAALTQGEALDVTAPGFRAPVGHLHPVSRVTAELVDIFRDLGFTAVEGPEVETEFYNFTALNIPPNHPARDMWNTFWLDKKRGALLRTHTSPVQVRYLEKHPPPLRIIVPGRAFRYEATDRTHDSQFSQIEGLFVAKTVSIAHFRAVIEAFISRFFKVAQAKIRLRPSYFPFVEPGFEVDAACVFCRQKGCPVCRHTGWLELAGAGLVHPLVFKNAKVKGKWQGFAFGFGLERLTMLRYQINDIRTFYAGDVGVTRQF